MFQAVKRFLRRKAVIGACAVAVVTGTAYQWTKTPAEPTRYVLTPVSRGTLVVSVGGSGQVSGERQIEVKPLVSGAVTRLLVAPGETVTEGTPIAEVDRRVASKSVRDASQSVRDAELSLAASALSLQRTKKPATATALLQAQHALNQAERSLADLREGATAEELRVAELELDVLREQTRMSADGVTPVSIRNAYDTATTAVKTAAQTYQQALYDADSVLGIDRLSANDAFERNLGVSDVRAMSNAVIEYQRAKLVVQEAKRTADALKTSGEARATVDAALIALEKAGAELDPLLQSTYDVLHASVPGATYSQATLDGDLSSMQATRSGVTTKIASLVTERQRLEQAKSSYVSALTSVTKSELALAELKRGPDATAIANAEERVSEVRASMEELKRGADVIDVAIAENSLEQRRAAVAAARNRLADAQETLQDYTVRAPFDGVIATVHVHPADTVSPSAAVATLITQTKIASMTLNEVDVAKVKAGQRATLTFDAIPDLSIAATVAEVDTLGTVAQGVVNYGVKLAFQTQDPRVKSGMSVAASVVTDVRTDALVLPNAAVTRSGEAAQVRTLERVSDPALAQSTGIPSETEPMSAAITVGIANDQSTEVTGGLNEGDLVVLRVVDAAAAAQTASRAGATQGSALRIPGMTGLGGGGAGGAVRIQR